ncbi:aminotransferase class I/II-fold pyridoxal phosphate-dependent enzyme, partial [Enterococcus faecalis]|uniref:aminotransferase class I/II-fold pyridoxal phosphate-dependent enzyme n=1 Tax=Enterococcus faecalis TaxID=1351 RepID=UPI003D6BEA47
PGDEVIIHDPYLSPYKDQVLLADCVPVFLPTYEEDGLQIDVALLKEKITPKIKAIILNTPNNPTGAVFSEETFREI